MLREGGKGPDEGEPGTGGPTFHEQPVEVCAFSWGVPKIFLCLLSNINSQAHPIQWPFIFPSRGLHDCFERWNELDAKALVVP